MRNAPCVCIPDDHDVYHGNIWGGVGFAILEDRKFKSSPSIVKAEMTRDSHITQKDYDTREADLPGAHAGHNVRPPSQTSTPVSGTLIIRPSTSIPN